MRDSTTPEPPPSTLMAALRTHIEAASQDAPSHPSADELLAYYLDLLDEERAERLREHFAQCPACSEAYLAMVADPGLGQPEAPGSATHGGSPLSEELRAIRGPRRLPDRRVAGWRAALAASLLVSLSGLLVSNLTLREQLLEMQQPRVARAVLDLVPENRPVRGGERTLDRSRLARDGGSFVLLLNGLDSAPGRYFAGELLDADGRRLWREGQLEADELGVMTVIFDSELLEAGRYRIVLREEESNGSETVFHLRVVDSGGSPR